MLRFRHLALPILLNYISYSICDFILYYISFLLHFNQLLKNGGGHV
jgi:hypothetical protein